MAFHRSEASGQRDTEKGSARLPSVGVRIRFAGLSVKEANVQAAELIDSIQRAASAESVVDQIELEPLKDPATMDMGATILAIVGTQAAIAIARGISQHIAKRGSRVVIESRDGDKIIAEGDGATNIDVAGTVAALQRYVTAE